jgi:hypothetical protein
MPLSAPLTGHTRTSYCASRADRSGGTRLLVGATDRCTYPIR